MTAEDILSRITLDVSIDEKGFDCLKRDFSENYLLSINYKERLDGATGGLIGAGAARLVKHGAELGLSLIDGYLLDGILKGWQPKLFINEYEKLVKTGQ